MSCNCSEATAKETVNKVRMKGISNSLLTNPHLISCECGDTFTMRTFESKCPSCGMVYAVTPCSADNVKNVKAAGINY